MPVASRVARITPRGQGHWSRTAGSAPRCGRPWAAPHRGDLRPLTSRMSRLHSQHVVVVGLSRGGVPVAGELRAPLDVIRPAFQAAGA